MKMFSRTLAILLFIILLPACVNTSTVAELPPTETLLPPTETPSPTATVVWFPPTPTSTRIPTQEPSPTPELKPDVGKLILDDDFSSSNDWTLSSTVQGSAALGKNELTIAIGVEEPAYIYSVRQQPVLGSFYAEINAQPALCKNSDEYGLLLRVNEAEDYYRFSLTCDGYTRLDRILGGQASSPQPPVLTGAVPPGASITSRLGVWASGKEMRFFANGYYLFTIQDPSLETGRLGVFARSRGTNALTVNFSDLSVWELNASGP